MILTLETYCMCMRMCTVGLTFKQLAQIFRYAVTRQIRTLAHAHTNRQHPHMDPHHYAFIAPSPASSILGNNTLLQAKWIAVCDGSGLGPQTYKMLSAWLAIMRFSSQYPVSPVIP